MLMIHGGSELVQDLLMLELACQMLPQLPNDVPVSASPTHQILSFGEPAFSPNFLSVPIFLVQSKEWKEKEQ